MTTSWLRCQICLTVQIYEDRRCRSSIPGHYICFYLSEMQNSKIIEVGGLSFLEASCTTSLPFAAGYFHFFFLNRCFVVFFLVKFTIIAGFGFDRTLV